ncbi:MAG: hypothetical protein WBX02_01165 [Terriglobales bacterium]
MPVGALRKDRSYRTPGQFLIINNQNSQCHLECPRISAVFLGTPHTTAVREAHEEKLDPSFTHASE